VEALERDIDQAASVGEVGDAVGKSPVRLPQPLEELGDAVVELDQLGLAVAARQQQRAAGTGQQPSPGRARVSSHHLSQPGPFRTPDRSPYATRAKGRTQRAVFS